MPIKNDTKKESAKVIEDIRVTSKSIHEVIKRLHHHWDDHGITVGFTDYPSHYQARISNSHSAPKGYPTNWGSTKEDVPTHYPGWAGRWEGSANCGFTDLIRGSCATASVPWLHTGTGSGGNKFCYDGRIFLYDFPAMHQQFIEEGSQFKVIENDYKIILDKYMGKLLKSRESYITAHSDFQQIDKLHDKIHNLYLDSMEAKEKTKAYLRQEYTNNYNTDAPLPSSIFTSDSISNALIDSSKKPLPIHPDLSGFHKRLRDLQEELQEHVKNHPEYLL